VIVLDTHAWIWWLSGSKKLSAAVRRKLDQAKQVGVCAISCWEVAMLVERKRLRFDREVSLWIDQALKAPGVELLPLEPEICVFAAQLGAQRGGDPADHLIVATARRWSAQLVTGDKRIEGWGLVPILW